LLNVVSQNRDLPSVQAVNPPPLLAKIAKHVESVETEAVIRSICGLRGRMSKVIESRVQNEKDGIPLIPGELGREIPQIRAYLERKGLEDLILLLEEDRNAARVSLTIILEDRELMHLENECIQLAGFEGGVSAYEKPSAEALKSMFRAICVLKKYKALVSELLKKDEQTSVESNLIEIIVGQDAIMHKRLQEHRLLECLEFLDSAEVSLDLLAVAIIQTGTRYSCVETEYSYRERLEEYEKFKITGPIYNVPDITSLFE